MAPSFLDKQTASCNSPHDWLMSLAMNKVALICVLAYDTKFWKEKNFTKQLPYTKNWHITY